VICIKGFIVVDVEEYGPLENPTLALLSIQVI